MYEEMTDIGRNHHIKLILDDDKAPIELVEYHLDPKGHMCGGIKSIDHDNWHIMDMANGITLMPSLQCDMCPSHGFIIDGIWYEHEDPDIQPRLFELWKEYKGEEVSSAQ